MKVGHAVLRFHVFFGMAMESLRPSLHAPSWKKLVGQMRVIGSSGCQTGLGPCAYGPRV